MNILLLGDSDIDRWPEDRLPGHESCEEISVSGRGGATLDQIIDPVKAKLQQYRTKNKIKETADKYLLILVLCAGENDIGSGIPLVQSEAAMDALLGTIFGDFSDCNIYLIFLGPKLEPWLQDDLEARRAYIQMSRSFQRICTLHSQTKGSAASISYIDCLTMFCGESANQPGALFGGRAIPEEQYFDKDQLHLSSKGYELWKAAVEEKIHSIL